MHVLRQRPRPGERRDSRFPQKATCLAIYSRVVNAQAQRSPRCCAETFPWCSERADELRRLFAAYAAEKQAQRVLDFDDLLVWWAAAMADPRVGARDRARASTTCWSTSTRTPTGCRRRSCSALRPDGRGLTVVGDDAQSIYSFRAAEVRNILDFAARASSRRRRVLTLEQQLPLDGAASSPPRTRSSRSPPSATPSSCGASAPAPSGRRWSGSTDEAAQATLGRRARAGACASRAWR